jgi:hypothetical protein
MSKKLKHLLLRSALIQNRIDHETKQKSRDWLKILRLKKLRLKIKDKIYAIAQGAYRNYESRNMKRIPIYSRQETNNHNNY